MKQKITLFFALIFVNFFGQAQTTLAAGDIAIIGVNYDTSPNYEITIVTLAPILANTQIRISDYWYNESTPNTLTNVQANTGTALDSEGSILWQPTSAINAGTIFKIGITKGGNTVTGLPGIVTVTGWTNPSTSVSPGNAGGENWFIYQGSSITNVSNFIFLWGNGFPIKINNVDVTPGQFVTTGSGNISSNSVTYLPPSLTLGTNAIALTTVTNHGNNNVYTGTFTGTKSAILAEICNISKWNHDELTVYDITPGGTSFPGTNPIFTLPTPNSAPTDITLSASSINENVAANTTVGTLSSTDADAGDSFNYTLVAGTGDTDNASFNISGSSLRINASPDFETKSSYSVRVRTTDQGGLTYDEAFTITITNINEAPTDIALSASSINENVAANTAVGALSSTDADAGNTFTYTLVAGTGDTDNAAFNISGSSLRITAIPDFETKSSYSVRLRTIDQGGLTYEEAFTITIIDQCELNNTATQTSGILTANQSGATYQWIQCPATILVGENGQSYTPTAIGSYAVVITIGSCSTISSCILVNTLANPDFEEKSKFIMYPNPSKGIVNINSDTDNTFLISNQLGQTVKTFKVKSDAVNSINVENLTDGIYFVKDSNKNKSYKLIIKK